MDRLVLFDADLRDPASVNSIIEQAKPDWIFHLAAQSYVQDYDEMFPATSWGHRYWPFLTAPYIGGKPANFNQAAGNIYVCASNKTTPQLISGPNNIWPEPATSWGLVRLPNGQIPYWCTYAINEHVPDEWPALGSWQAPAESFLFLEGSDSDIEGDECDEVLFAHNDGLNITFIDGHAKWRKAEFANNDPTVSANWIYPPAGGGGMNDRGPWTAPDHD